MTAALLVVAAVALPAPRDLRTTPPPNDNGRHLRITWRMPEGQEARKITAWRVYRSDGLLGTFGRSSPSPDDDPAMWRVVKTLPAETLSYDDEPPNHRVPYRYAVKALATERGADLEAEDLAVLGESPAVVAGPDRPVSAWFDRSKAFMLAIVVAMLTLLAVFLDRARRAGKKMYVRRIPGIDALEEAIGRSTEMGRPVLYVPGIDEMQNIQTIASMLILGHVSELVAKYDTELKVPCAYALNMVVAEEIVRQGFLNAGRPDAHRPQNIQFISSEQFAFCAGTNGIMLRDKPATNIFLGRFFAESLIFAETGYVNKAIQIAGTAEITQLPFFIAACDYTIIGEELYAVSAYLSREPKLLSALKATDYVKLGVIAVILIGAILNTFGVYDVGKLILP
jgi:hypothetical protein